MTTDIARQDSAVVMFDPQLLIEKAIERGTDIATVERIIALAKEVRAERAREAWHAAMAEFQQKCPAIKKTSTAKIQTSRASYTYKFAPLDEIVSVISPVMGELGLSIRWFSTIEPNRVIVTCKVSHTLGHSEESGAVSMPIMGTAEGAGANPAQQVGIALTYAKRYSLLGITGMAPEADTDGSPSGGVGPSQQETTNAGEPDRSNDDRVITENMAKRFHAIANGQKWTAEQLHELLTGFGYGSSKEIRSKDYDRIVDHLKDGFEKWRDKMVKKAAEAAA